MTILELYQSDGFTFKKETASEYSGRCPWCSGKDRFRIWPDQGENGKYWCRGCGRSGDAIQYLRDHRRMSFQEACSYLGRELPNAPSLSGRSSGRKVSSPWEPRVTVAPTDIWQAKARRLVDDAVYHLWSPQGKKTLDFLKNERGLTEATIKKFSLGFCPLDRWEAAPAWGLEEILKEDGKPKKLWIPAGLSIPLCQGGQVLRVRIRRPEPGDGPRYYLLRGSDTKAMVIGQDKKVYVIVESELDTILLAQESGDLVGVVALGNAQARPDQEALEALERSRLILVALDGDEAGAKEAWGWWRSHFSQAARRWPPVAGKDPTDMHLAGVNLRNWISAGLAEYMGVATQPETEPEPKPQAESAHEKISEEQPEPEAGDTEPSHSPSISLSDESENWIWEIIKLATDGELTNPVLLPVRPAYRDILGNSVWICPDQASAGAKAPDLAFCPDELIEVLPLLTNNRQLAAAIIEAKRVMGGTIIDPSLIEAPTGNFQEQEQEPEREGLPQEGRHIVRVTSVKGQKRDSGNVAVLKMEILAGDDSGKTITDTIPLPRQGEPKEDEMRRLQVAYAMGLIEQGKETVTINFKHLEGKVCLVDLIHEEFQGQKVVSVVNYIGKTAR